MARSDGELVRETLAGGRDAFGELVERHRRTVYALALQRGFQPAEAEDAAQEVFVKAYGALGKLQSPDAFAAWLYGIAGHVFADAARARRRSREDAGLDEAAEALLFEEPGESLLLDAPVVWRALRELPEAQRLVLTLRYAEGLSPKEIAQRLGQPRGTVRSHLHHGLAALQAVFSGARTQVAGKREREIG